MKAFTICNGTQAELHPLWEQSFTRAGLRPVTLWSDIETDGNFNGEGYGELIRARAKWWAHLCETETEPFCASDVDVVAFGTNIADTLAGPLFRATIALAREGRGTSEFCNGFWVAKPSAALAAFWRQIAERMERDNLFNDQPLTNALLPQSGLSFGYLPDCVQSGTFRPPGVRCRIFHANNTIPRNGKSSMQLKREAISARMPTSAAAVIAHTEENLGWLRNLQMPFTIVTSKPRQPEPRMLVENEGREAGKWLKWLLANYNSLPEYVVFLQGQPLHHCPDLFDQLNDGVFAGFGFYPLGPMINPLVPTDSEHDAAARDFARDMLGGPCPLSHWVAGAQMVVHRSRIRRHPEEYYERLLAEVINHPLGPWCIERRWTEIF